MRYIQNDDFCALRAALPAYNLCYMDALCHIGRKDTGRQMFEVVLGCRNALELLFKNIHPESRELWGNFPQAYSMAGIINMATRLSSSWEEA